MKQVIAISVMLLTSNLSFGHADHAPRMALCAASECTQTEIEKAVPKALEMLTASGKVDASWVKAKVEKVEVKQFKKGNEWMATLLDEKQKDAKKKRLYVFITTKGFLNGSNYTGE